MWFSKTQNGYLGWLAIANSSGVLRTGLAPSAFTATVRNPQDTSSFVPTVSESGKLGLYKFFISSSFLVTNGTGSYGCVIELNATGPVLRDVYADVLQVYQRDFDDFASISQSQIASIASSASYAVWSADTVSNQQSGTMGALLVSASQGPTPVIDNEAIATAVWNRQLSSHTVSGSAGYSLSTIYGLAQKITGTLSLATTDIEFIRDMTGGRWLIDNNQMIFYSEDNVTEVARFDLYDSSGVPTEDAVFERVKV